MSVRTSMYSYMYITTSVYMHMLFSPQGLNVADLEDLLEDIEIYRKIEKDTNQEFWMVRSAYTKSPFLFK